MKKLFSLFLVFLPSLSLAAPAVDSRLTFSFADNDILSGPNGGIADEDNELFDDNWEGRDTGSENLTHFVLYTRQPGFFANLDTEAALVLRAERGSEDYFLLKDDGSYINLIREFDSWVATFTAFPLSSDRFRLGYSYKISWGGDAMFGAQEPTPGLRLSFKRPGFNAFIGAKTSRRSMLNSDGISQPDTTWGLLGGAGIDVAEELQIEFNGGYFRRGQLAQPGLVDYDTQTGEVSVPPWDAFGGSVQVVYHIGMPVGEAIDFWLYKNDILAPQRFFEREIYEGRTSFALMGEFTALGQTLQESQDPSSTMIQKALAGDFQARYKSGFSRVHFLSVFRDTSFILFDAPGEPRYMSWPTAVKNFPEVFASITYDYYFQSIHFTPGISFGARRPAFTSVVTDTGEAPPDDQATARVIIDADSRHIRLDLDQSVGMIYIARQSGKWDLSEAISFVYELQLSYDTNRPNIIFAPTTSVQPELSPLIAGFNLILQARF